MIRFETAAAASRSEFDDLDYSSFDEEELEIISGLLDKHRAVAATSTPGPTATNRVPVSTEILIQDLVTVKKDDAGGDKYSSSCEVKYQPLPPYHKENAEPIVIQCEGKEHGGLDEGTRC